MGRHPVHRYVCHALHCRSHTHWQPHFVAVAASGRSQSRSQRRRGGCQRCRRGSGTRARNPWPAVRPGRSASRMTRATITMKKDAVADGNGPKPVVVIRELPLIQKVWGDAFVRKTVIILLLAVAWEVYGRLLDNPLLFPTLSDTIAAFSDRIGDGVLVDRAWTSIKVLLIGYGLGITLAAIIT